MAYLRDKMLYQVAIHTHIYTVCVFVSECGQKQHGYLRGACIWKPSSLQQKHHIPQFSR